MKIEYHETTPERWDKAEGQAQEFIRSLPSQQRERLAKHIFRHPELLDAETRDDQLAVSLTDYYELYYDDLDSDSLSQAYKEWKDMAFDMTTANHYANNAMKALNGTFHNEGKEILRQLGVEKFDESMFDYLGHNTYNLMGIIIIQFHQSPAGMEWWFV